MKAQQPLVDREYLLEKFPGKGGWTYAVIPEIKPDPHAWFGWISVKGFLDDVELPRCKLMPKGDGQLFLPVNATMRKKLKKQAGDTVRIVLFSADEAPLLPEDIRACFEFEPPEALAAYQGLSPDEQHAHLKHINAAQTADTRANRIREMMDTLIAKPEKKS